MSAKIEQSKQKIKGTRTMNLTIKEGKDFVNEDDKPLNGATENEEPKLQRKSTMKQTINESENFLAKSKSKKITTNRETSRSSKRSKS